MVDVGDDGDVADVVAGGHEGSCDGSTREGTPRRGPRAHAWVSVGAPRSRGRALHATARGALSHLELYVSDLERSVEFWTAILGWLGYAPFQEWDEGVSFRSGPAYLVFVQAPEGAAGLDRRAVGLNHLAFSVGGPAEVDELTATLRDRGVRILYEDRHPHAGGPDHYAVFFEDPDGLKVEVVATGA